MFLYAQTPISKHAVRMNAAAGTYRSQEDECLLEIAQGFDFLVADSGRNALDETVKVRETLFVQNRLDNMLVNLVGSVFAQAALFICSFRDAGE